VSQRKQLTPGMVKAENYQVTGEREFSNGFQFSVNLQGFSVLELSRNSISKLHEYIQKTKHVSGK
jgi:hypothetical protein